jgi:hypothetical protein
MADQEILTREDIESARRAIEAAVAAGTLTPEEGAIRSEKVLHAVTPHDLYVASGGLAGSKQVSREARAERRIAVYVVIGIVAVAILMTLAVTGILGRYFG